MHKKRRHFPKQHAQVAHKRDLHSPKLPQPPSHIKVFRQLLRPKMPLYPNGICQVR